MVNTTISANRWRRVRQGTLISNHQPTLKTKNKSHHLRLAVMGFYYYLANVPWGTINDRRSINAFCEIYATARLQFIRMYRFIFQAPFSPYGRICTRYTCGPFCEFRLSQPRVPLFRPRQECFRPFRFQQP